VAAAPCWTHYIYSHYRHRTICSACVLQFDALKRGSGSQARGSAARTHSRHDRQWIAKRPPNGSTVKILDVGIRKVSLYLDDWSNDRSRPLNSLSKGSSVHTSSQNYLTRKCFIAAYAVPNSSVLKRCKASYRVCEFQFVRPSSFFSEARRSEKL
jgi:hypothetical protein